MASAGTVSVKVEPDTSGFVEAINRAMVSALAPWLRVLLHQYSEWLDGESMIKRAWSGGDDRSHDELVEQFLAERHPQAQPPVSPV